MPAPPAKPTRPSSPKCHQRAPPATNKISITVPSNTPVPKSSIATPATNTPVVPTATQNPQRRARTSKRAPLSKAASQITTASLATSGGWKLSPGATAIDRWAPIDRCPMPGMYIAASSSAAVSHNSVAPPRPPLSLPGPPPVGRVRGEEHHQETHQHEHALLQRCAHQFARSSCAPRTETRVEYAIAAPTAISIPTSSTIKLSYGCRWSAETSSACRVSRGTVATSSP